MPLVNTKELFKKAYEGKYAVGAFNVDNLDECQAALLAAEECQSPIILSFSKGSREYFHPGNIKDVLEVVARDTIHIPYVIHLDHGKSIDVCKSCIDEGFTSVMMDASEYDFEENIRQTREVVEYAHARGAVVEGELGPDLNSPNPRYHRYTDPKQAIEFIKRSGVDSLAVSIGTKHGLAKFEPGEEPEFQWDIIEEIQKACPGFPLVLHGSSSVPKKYLDMFNDNGGALVGVQGVPEELLQRVATTAVCKINIGTDFRVAYIGGFRKSLTEIKNRFEPRNFLVPARENAKQLVKEKLTNVFKSAYKAL